PIGFLCTVAVIDSARSGGTGRTGPTSGSSSVCCVRFDRGDDEPTIAPAPFRWTISGLLSKIQLQRRLFCSLPKHAPACMSNVMFRRLNLRFSMHRLLHSRQGLVLGGFLLLLITSVGLRVYRLNTYSLWLDEATQYQIATLPLKQMLCELP